MLDLSQKELIYLRNFNRKLSELERTILKEARACLQTLILPPYLGI
jgi:hypothetical protein